MDVTTPVVGATAFFEEEKRRWAQLVAHIAQMQGDGSVFDSSICDWAKTKSLNSGRPDSDEFMGCYLLPARLELSEIKFILDHIGRKLSFEGELSDYGTSQTLRDHHVISMDCESIDSKLIGTNLGWVRQHVIPATVEIQLYWLVRRTLEQKAIPLGKELWCWNGPHGPSEGTYLVIAISDDGHFTLKWELGTSSAPNRMALPWTMQKIT